MRWSALRRLAWLGPVLAACSTVTVTIEGDWRPYQRLPDAAHDTALRVLGELGYTLEEDHRRPEGVRLVGRYEGTDAAHGEAGSAPDVSIVETVEVQAAGAGCEIRVRTVGVLHESQKQRALNAHDRLQGRLDSALRQDAAR